MTISFSPLINRILEVAETSAGTDNRTIPTGSFRYDSSTLKSNINTAIDAVVKPIFEIEDIIPKDINSWSEIASTCEYEIEVRLICSYEWNRDANNERSRLVIQMRDDMHKVRRALANPDTLDAYQGTSTGLASGCLEFLNVSPIRWDSARGLASETLVFRGYIVLDFAE